MDRRPVHEALERYLKMREGKWVGTKQIYRDAIRSGYSRNEVYGAIQAKPHHIGEMWDGEKRELQLRWYDPADPKVEAARKAVEFFETLPDKGTEYVDIQE